MALLKYFERIRQLRAADEAMDKAPLPAFDFESLGSRNAFARYATRILLRRVLPVVAFVLRQLWPNPRFGRVVLVTRAKDVAQVLGDNDRFLIVYGEEMIDLGGGVSNVLGLDGNAHRHLRAMLDKAALAQDLKRVSDGVSEDATALLAAGAGRIDIMRDLISRTASEAACRFFGLTAHDPDLFGQWTMAVSNQLFGDFTGDGNIHRQAKIASAHLQAMVDDAITRVRWNNERHPASTRERVTLIDRLVTDQNVEPTQVRATIIGLVTAFIPTNTLAAGNIVEALLGKPRLMEEACAAARKDDAAAMRTVLLEAARLNPALSPGLWRHVPDDGKPGVIGTGWRRRRTRPGDLILACIPSALRDGRGVNDADASAKRRWLMFGSGPHDCWGAELALAHLVPVFIALLRQRGLRPAPDKHGGMLRVSPYPARMDMVYDAPQARRAKILAACPVRADVPRSRVEAALDALGNPARSEIAATLSQSNRVQFASLSVIERAPGSDDSILLVEISGDGEERELLALLAHHCLSWLAPVLSFCRPADNPITDASALAAVLWDGYFALDQGPFGNTGLHFDGMDKLSVADIARQDQVATFARAVIDTRLTYDLGLNTRAMGLLLHTRRLLRGDSFLGLRRENSELQEQALKLGLRGALLRPSRKRLAMADWVRPQSLWPGIKALVLAPENRLIPASIIALVTIWIATLLVWQAPNLFGPTHCIVGIVLAIAAALPLSLLTVAVAVGVVALWLRWCEQREPVDDRAAALDHVEAIMRREDAPGYVQNHIIAVMPFKPGFLRRLTFAFSMWGILQTVRFFFRPGFVVTMGTIHKARWFRVPATEQFVFLSNYDGSWESYLEDFICRAHEGQTAAWSHGVGFPKTRYLILDGATDGDRFKRWVRLQQRESRFWYSRFPHLTAQQIRNNAMIEDGLARATSDTDARRWLANFGSAQREPDELETEEAQSIIFSGQPRMSEATALLVRLPSDRRAAGKWLGAVSGLAPRPMEALVGPPKRWMKRGRGEARIHLPPEARILFGDQSWTKGGATLGLTARGLNLCGLDHDGGLDAMPPAFRLTMGERARLLGDAADAAKSWRFSDHPDHANEVHALFMIYGHEDDRSHEELIADHKALLTHFCGEIVHEVPCTQATGRDGLTSLEYEPFGFRDGISQPVIRGTRRAAQPVSERDMVAAGEFLLGYRNLQGYLPPTIAVGAERDPACDLPTVSAADANRFPWFGNRAAALEPRDFGRNGSFLAVRQLDQDVDRFWDQAATVCARLRSTYPDLAELPGNRLSQDWVAARMIGRWPNGTPLVGNRDKALEDVDDKVPLNDFAYGVDDPRGLACPLGAHIRRTNPRDSQEPGDAEEQQITNRHRLLRRGRAYRYPADGVSAGTRDGLLFMALCADLERQFEFVQRTWINATTFHGLTDEHDPLMAPHQATRASPGFFTIPTVAGPVRVPGLQSFVQPRGGGYFFIPSRSALAHLVRRSQL